MFSAKLPCLAIDYNCIDELVKINHNGQIFKNEKELKNKIVEVLSGFNGKDGTDILKKYVRNLQAFAAYDWETQWIDVVLQNILNIEKEKFD